MAIESTITQTNSSAPRPHRCVATFPGLRGHTRHIRDFFEIVSQLQHGIIPLTPVLMIKIQKHSNYGTSTPAVARTIIQGHELLSFFQVGETQKESCIAVLMDLKRHLLGCIAISEQIQTQVEQAKKEFNEQGLQFQSKGRAVTLPTVVDLHSQAESFLQSSKLALADTARLVVPFFGGNQDHRFHKLAAWSAKEFGHADLLTQAAFSWEPWVKLIVDMRNAVDHPQDGPKGKLVVHNFQFSGTQNEPSLLDPAWSLTQEPGRALLPEMAAIVEGCIELGEEILVALFYKFTPNMPLKVVEVALEERDPAKPVRLRVELNF